MHTLDAKANSTILLWHCTKHMISTIIMYCSVKVFVLWCTWIILSLVQASFIWKYCYTHLYCILYCALVSTVIMSAGADAEGVHQISQSQQEHKWFPFEFCLEALETNAICPARGVEPQLETKHIDGVLYLNKVTSIETLLDIP